MLPRSSQLVNGWVILLLILFSICAVGTFLLIPLHYQNKDTGAYYRVSTNPTCQYLPFLLSTDAITYQSKCHSSRQKSFNENREKGITKLLLLKDRIIYLTVCLCIAYKTKIGHSCHCFLSHFTAIGLSRDVQCTK